jgi:hypothetical protein
LTASCTVSVTVTEINNPPVCQDDSFTTPQDTRLSIFNGQLLSNDSDPDGDNLLVWEYDFVTSQGGSNDCCHIGGFNYTPPLAFTGVDTFEYTIADRADGSGLTDNCTVSVTVVPPDDRIGVYYDSFSGADGSFLDGRTTEVGGGAWEAGAGAILSNGTVTTVDFDTVAGVPVTPTATSQLTIAADVDPTGSDWSGFGFASSATGGYGNAGEIWVGLAPAGTYWVHAFGTAVTLASGTIPGTATNGFHHVEIRYDARTRLVTVTLNGVEVVSSQELPAAPNIQFAGFHLRNGTPDVTRLDHFDVRVGESPTQDYDSFSGADGSPLDGRATEVGGGVWQALSGAILSDGTVTAGTAGTLVTSAGVPLTPTATSLLSVAADVDPTGSSWSGFGFASSATGSYSSVGEIWVGLAPAGTYWVHAFGTAVTLASGTIPGTATNGFHHVEIRYDARTRLVTVTLNGVEVVSSQELPAAPNTQFAGFHLRNGTLDVTRLDHFDVRVEE